MIKYLLAMLLTAAVCSAMSQNHNDPSNYIRTDLISSSPTAGDMTRYGDIPVTLYTGMTNVSIPIFECGGRNLSLPITLNYNYSGFKPQQKASWVGLGWTLSTGGVITRTIRDKVDGTMSAGRNYYEIRDSLISMAQYDSLFLEHTVDAPHDGVMYDTEPDVYSFNFPGHSGKFIVVGSVFYAFPKNRLKIQGDALSGFTITTDEGILYQFDIIETTHQRGTAGANYTMPDFNSAFHLSRITHPTGDYIEFVYVNEGTVQQIGTRTQTFKKGSGNTPSELRSPKITYPTDIQNTRRLSEIHSSKCSVYFVPGTTRKDVDGNQRVLGAIEIKDHYDSFYKRFDFNTHYFGNTDSDLTCYLKLNAVVEKGADGTTAINKGYRFDYFDENASYPVSVSAAIDHYGYLNGSGTRSNLIPISFVGNQIGGTSYGVNRTPVFNYTKYGALQRVIYPTQGETTFEYEANIIPTGTSTSQGEIAVDHLDRIEESSDVRVSEGKFFNLTHDQNVTIDLQRFQKSGYTTQNILTDLKIHQYDPVYDQSMGTPILATKLPANSSVEEFTVNLPKGKYFYQITMDEGENNVAVEISYVATIPDSIPGPGIRIKQVISNPLDGQPLVKQYTYSDDDGLPSGLSEGQGYYPSGFSTEVNGITKFYTIYNTSVGMAHSPTLEIFYRQVNEFTVSDSGSLKTSYIFHKFQSVTSFNFLDAALERRIDYRLKGGQYQIAKKVVNDYHPVGGPVFLAIKPFLSGYTFQDGSSGFDNEMYVYSYDAYALQSQWYYLKKTTESVFTDGLYPLEKVVEYQYDIGTTYLKEERHLQSDGARSIPIDTNIPRIRLIQYLHFTKQKIC